MGRRLLVMGDIHGQYEKMMRVLMKSGYDPAGDRLILLGDYVDRGPESSLVVQEVKKLVGGGALALYGNHEDLMLAALSGRIYDRLDSQAVEQWYANGGEITLNSYRAGKSLIEEHLHFFSGLPLWHEADDFLFVHAGLRPGLTLEKQAPQDLIWIREEYIQGYTGPWRVITGHTPTQYLKRYELFPDIEDATRPVIRQWQIFLDTGAAWGGPLTMMELPSQKYWQA